MYLDTHLAEIDIPALLEVSNLFRLVKLKRGENNLSSFFLLGYNRQIGPFFNLAFKLFIGKFSSLICTNKALFA